MIAGAAGVVLVALGLGYVLFGGGSGGASASDASKHLEAAGCTLQSVQALPSNNHTLTNPTDTSPKWNTSPPTSGPHNSTPAICGAYTAPLIQAQVVHNLEHGGVFVQYGEDVPAGDDRQLGPSTTNTRTGRCSRRSRASARRSPSACGRRPVPPRRTTAPRTSSSADVRRRRLRRVLRRLPVQGPGALSEEPPRAGRVRRLAGNEALHSGGAGVAKLVIRARLKIGCPSGRLGSTPSPGIAGSRGGGRSAPSRDAFFLHASRDPEGAGPPTIPGRRRDALPELREAAVEDDTAPSRDAFFLHASRDPEGRPAAVRRRRIAA